MDKPNLTLTDKADMRGWLALMGALAAAGLAIESPTLRLADPATFTDGVPHEAFRRLRHEDPIHWNPEPDGGRVMSEYERFMAEMSSQYK